MRLPPFPQVGRKSPCDADWVSSDPDVTFDSPRTDVGHPTTPLPALGLALALAYLVLGMEWSVLSARTSSHPDRPLYFMESLVSTALMVVPPLLITRVPAPLRRQAAPFLILAGALNLAFAIIPNYYLLGSASAYVAYAMGWMRFRGRPTLALLAALGTPILMLVSSPLMQVFLPHLAVNATDTVAVRLPWYVGYSLLFAVLPVCVPVLLTGLARFRSPSVRATPSYPVPSAVPIAPAPVDPGWNAFAVASLVFSLVLGAPWAIVLGHIAHAQIRRTHEKGSGLAIGGLVLGYGSIVAVGLLIWFIYEAFKNWTYTF